MKEYQYECLACGQISACSEDKEPEECHGCGEHKPERFKFVGEFGEKEEKDELRK